MNRSIFVALVACSLAVSGFASEQEDVAPSQNTELNTLTPSGKIDPDKKGFLQRRYDYWEKKEWEPNAETSEEEKTSPAAVAPEKSPEAVTAAPEEISDAQNSAAAENTTVPEHDTPEADQAETNQSATPKGFLQYYYDKWDHYLDEKEKQRSGPLHSEQLEQMPVIGK